jgi:hypothetical protein
MDPQVRACFTKTEAIQLRLLEGIKSLEVMMESPLLDLDPCGPGKRRILTRRLQTLELKSDLLDNFITSCMVYHTLEKIIDSLFELVSRGWPVDSICTDFLVLVYFFKESVPYDSKEFRERALKIKGDIPDRKPVFKYNLVLLEEDEDDRLF